MKNILLLHGAIGAKDQLDGLKKQLEGQFKVYTFNFSGHGKSHFKERFSIEQFTKDTLSFMLSEKLVEVAIFGYSMGGYVALNLAKHYPEKVSHLITLGTKFKWTPEIAAKEVKMLNPELIKLKIPVFANSLEKRHGSGWEVLLGKTADMMLEMGENPPLTLSDYQSIKQPSKLLLADKDEMVSKEETLEVYKALPNSQFSVLPNSKHPIEKVNIELLSKEISATM